MVLALAALACLGGCAQSQRAATQAEGTRELRRETTTVRQVLAPDGAILELREQTVTVETEASATQGRSEARTELEPPKVLDAAVRGLSQVADRMVPGGGMAVNMLWQVLAGSGAIAAGGGAAAVLRERKRARELVQAQDAYAKDIERADTDAEVAQVKAKHEGRQKALGIHTALTRARHGA
jgi:hypothetical protein